MMKFKAQYQCEYESMPLNVKAWIAYHRAADSVDGHLPIGDRSLARWAVQAGFNAMRSVDPTMIAKEDHEAKSAALRIVESEPTAQAVKGEGS